MPAAAQAALRAEAMACYVLRHVRPAVPFRADDLDGLVDGMRLLRDDIRDARGGETASGELLKALAARHGWRGLPTSYLGPDGGVVEIDHHVAVFADGTIVDPSADAHGEGFDIRVLRPTDVEYGRYRPEFEDDWNPKLDPIRLGGWAFEWSGVGDLQARDELREARGFGWWVEEASALTAFLRIQRERAAAAGAGVTASELARHLDDLARFASARCISPGSARPS